MSTLSVWGELVACQDKAELAEVAAVRIAAGIEAKLRTQRSVSLALSGGTTPRETYERLATVKNVDWRRVLFFWVDERSVPPTDERSNFRMVEDALLRPLAVSPDQIARMHGEQADLIAAARAYELLLRERLTLASNQVPQIDILTLGVGADGHTASLFPYDAALSEDEALVVAVDPTTEREARLTLSFPMLLSAANVFVLASGAEKAAALERAWATLGDERQTPLRGLRNARGATTWLIDRAAGGLGRSNVPRSQS
jgi:6-phosphogluconolactonase